ncbi:MAG: hypothetical protein GQ542_01380 [Desulforhopalus sp.]|nr:hypothetical protein [Desulforhopalus sp.]
MAQKSRLAQFVCVAIFAACMIDSSLAAWGSKRAPAGQVCPSGSYVIGFDTEANIICSEACGNGVLNPGETCDDGNTESGDSCPATCRSERAEPGGADEETAAQAVPMDTGISPTTSNAIISDVKPSKLNFGTPELEITVSGTGFHADSIIIFEGTKYTPWVNQAGTQLKVTIPTGNLSIGPYRITVSNGSGMETTVKRALEIY